MRYRAAVFDMDGTILNTAGDLADALNYAMRETGHRHDYTEEQVRGFVGSGIRTAIGRAFDEERRGAAARQSAVGEMQKPPGAEEAALSADAEETERVLEVFLPYYETHCAVRTDSYPGICDMIRALRERGILTAVVSNKPDAAVKKLAQDYFDGLFDLAVGEQAGIRRKPAPDMTEKALAALGVRREEAVYIGDSEVDLETAENAGLLCIACAWGFRGAAFLRAHGAELLAEDAEDVRRIILGEA